MLVAMAQEAKAERRPRVSREPSALSMKAWASLTVGAAAKAGTARRRETRRVIMRLGYKSLGGSKVAIVTLDAACKQA